MATTSNKIHPKLATLEQESLGVVNSMRRALGLKPLKAFKKGLRRDPRACAIARCLNVSGITATVRHRTIDFDDAKHAKRVAHALKLPYRTGSVSVRTPKQLRAFIEAFDKGRLPHLVA